MGIYNKLLLIMEDLGYFQKDGKNTFQNYKYVSEAKAKDQFREQLIKNKMVMLPTGIEPHSMISVGDKVHSWARYEYTVIDTETEESVKIYAMGSGVDNGDKHSYKASAGAMKYAIMQLLLTPTGDDPEVPREDEKPKTKTKPVTTEPAQVNDEEKKKCESCSGDMEYKPGGVATVAGQKKRYPAFYSCTGCGEKVKA